MNFGSEKEFRDLKSSDFCVKQKKFAIYQIFLALLVSFAHMSPLWSGVPTSIGGATASGALWIFGAWFGLPEPGALLLLRALPGVAASGALLLFGALLGGGLGDRAGATLSGPRRLESPRACWSTNQTPVGSRTSVISAPP